MRISDIILIIVAMCLATLAIGNIAKILGLL